MEKIEMLWQQLITSGVSLGKHILTAIIIYIVGHFLIRVINKALSKLMNRKALDPEIHSFFGSAVSIGLNVLLIIAIIGALGIETTSFAALLASAGVAIGMALSGQMQNLAGGVMILIQRPYRIGDYIVTSGTEGIVTSIQIFSTRLCTPDNKIVIIPNGNIASSVLTNYSAEKTRRVDLTIGIEYNSDVDKVRQVLQELIDKDEQILKTPAPTIAVIQLADSSVNVTLRVWVESANYWVVYFRTNEAVYKEFNARGISFPFPQLTVHQA